MSVTNTHLAEIIIPGTVTADGQDTDVPLGMRVSSETVALSVVHWHGSQWGWVGGWASVLGGVGRATSISHSHPSVQLVA